MGCKIDQKKEEGVQNCTISKKIGGKSAIEHKDEVQNRSKKRGGAKSHNWQKIGGKVQLSQNFNHYFCSLFLSKFLYFFNEIVHKCVEYCKILSNFFFNKT